MTKNYSTDEPTKAFWLTHADPTQAAVHLALQWLAYVYPASELQIDRTLKHAVLHADTDLSSRWSQFLDENDVEEHVDALEWLAQTLSEEQMPFLVETCWRLLLVDHELPTHVPLALRILGQVLDISESRIHEIGDSVHREYNETDETRNRAPLLPVDPRYLDRVEWRLYGHSATQRLNYQPVAPKKERNLSGFYGFGWGSVFGALVVVGLVFGPLQLGRVKVPIMLHDGLLVENADVQPQLINTDPIVEIQPIPESTDSAPSGDLLVDESAIETTLSEQADTTITVPEVEEPNVNADSDVEPTLGSTSNRVLMEVTASILNVRAEANVESDILIKLAGGARVWAYPEEAVGLWMLVKVEDQVGYASARFLGEVSP